ncbi:MAG: peptide chain release factor-like protein [Candidatus Woesearchaeota archaeon]|jgi:protein subunit release factor B
MEGFIYKLNTKYLEKIKDLEIYSNDIVEQFIRGSGHGGQKVNKTSSTVYLKHLPTSLEVKCQQFREREKNRILAYQLLINKIEDLKKGKESEKDF